MCVRVMLAEPDGGYVSGRTLDMSTTGNPVMEYRPAGNVVAASPTLEWTAEHATLTISDFDGGVLDGVNDSGLAGHGLMFTDAVYEADDDRPELPGRVWLQYLLDTCSTVAEAVERMALVRVSPAELLGRAAGVHMVVEDLTGATAVFEPLDGQMVITQGHDYPVVANAPSMTEQLRNLARYRPFGGELPPPGDIISPDRFVRASYFLHYLPEPVTNAEAVGDVCQVLATVAKPPGVPYPTGEVFPTLWFSAIDLKSRTYYFWSRRSPAMLWVALPDLDADHSLSVSLFDPALAGDITADFH